MEESTNQGMESATAHSTEVANAEVNAEVAQQHAQPVEQASATTQQQSAPERDEDKERLRSYIARERKLRQQRREFEKRAAEIEQREAALKEKLEKLESEYKLLESDPLSWAESKKLDKELIARRILEPKSKVEEKLEELEKQIRSYKERDEEEKRKREELSKKEALAQAERRLISLVKPEIHTGIASVWAAHEFPRAVDLALSAPVDGGEATVLEAFVDEYGRYPTDEEVVDYMEAIAQTKIRAWAERQQPKQQAQAPQAPTNSGKQATKTLTNSDAADRLSGGSREKTREERARELAAMLAAEAST
jgi:hypothetical protein